jgi:hypothetical protein
MVYPADDTRIRLTLLRRELRATVERIQALVEQSRRMRAVRAARASNPAPEPDLDPA